MGVMEGALINRSKQSRKENPSAMRGQLGRIRKADPAHTDDGCRASRCIVTNRNTTPGSRASQEAGRMDCHQRVQNGHRVLYADRCRGSGHSLMSLMVFAFMAMVLVLPVSGNSEPCHNTQEVSDEWRDLSSSQNSKTDNCDENKFQPNTWYSFNLRGKAAWIPTQCVKSNMCGASVGMRVDLLGQSLPSVGENITAALCGAYDVLGKYDCCVLRTEVYISRCHDQRLVYRFPNPIDRCPVAVCTQGEPIIPPGIVVKTGDDVNKTGDSTRTDIPETTSEEYDSTTAESTTVIEPASDDTTVVEPASDDTTVVEESTETPQPPQPFMQTTTESETTTADVDQELSTAEATPEAASSTPSTEDASSNAAVDDTEATTTDAPQASESVTGSDTESDTSTTIIRDMFTLTSSPTPEETTELTATPYDHTSTEADSTDAALPVDDVSKETTSDNIQDASSAADLQSSTDMSTSEQPTTELQPTTQGMAIEELSSTSQTPHDTDGSDGSDDEATDSTSHDVSRTTSAESSTTESHEPVSKSAAEEEDSSISTSGITSTTTIEETATTPTTTESLLETTVTTRKSTKLIKPMPPSGTTTEEMEVATRSGSGDVEMNEKMRFVFIGKPQDVAPVAEVHALLDKFLLRTKADSKWTYTVVSESEAMNYENRSTYMDFRIVRLGNDLKDGATFFKENQFGKYVSDNTNMILIDQCRASKNCQEDFDHPTVLASVFEQNAPAFTAVIVLCAICLLILILVVLYTRFSKRGSWRAPEPDPNAQPENRREYNGTNSPFTDEQIVKDEMLDNASASLNGSAKDGDTNLSGTWVIPLDQEASNPHTSVSITTEDTKF